MKRLPHFALRRSVFPALLAGVVLARAQTQAADLTWDADPGTGGLQDGSGTWGSSGPNNWFNGASDQAFGSGNNAVFGVGNGAAGTVTLGSVLNVGNITFQPPGSGAYIIAPSGSFTLNTSAGAVITANASATISASLADQGNGFTKAGGAILTLSGSNAVSGKVQVNAGVLALASNGALSDTSSPLLPGVVVASGAQVQIAGGIATTSFRSFSLAGSGLSGTGALLFSGSGGKYLGLTLIGGTPSFGAAGGTAATPNQLGNLSGGGGWSKVGTGALSLEDGALGAHDYTGLVTVAAGTLLAHRTGVAINGDLQIDFGAIFGLKATNQLASTTNVTVNGTFDLALGTGNADYTATMNSLAGTGVIKATTPLNAGRLTVSSTTADSTFGGSIQGQVDVRKVGAGTTLTLAGVNTASGTVTVSSGTLALTGSWAGTETIAVAGTLQIEGTLSGSLDLDVNTGTLAGRGRIAGTTGSSVLLRHSAHLSPGTLSGETGTLTLALPNGTLDLSDPGVSDVFRFDLGTPADSDRVVLESGTLSQFFAFSQFTFTPLAGFGNGTYTLFDTSSAISGEIDPTDFTGLVGGRTATLGLADNGRDVVLVVIPEPASAGLLVVALGLFGWRRRR